MSINKSNENPENLHEEHQVKHMVPSYRLKQEADKRRVLKAELEKTKKQLAEVIAEYNAFKVFVKKG